MSITYIGTWPKNPTQLPPTPKIRKIKLSLGTWDQIKTVNLNTKYPHLGSLSLSYLYSHLGHNLVTRQYLPIPCPRATDPVAGWHCRVWPFLLACRHHSHSALISCRSPIRKCHVVPQVSQLPGSRGEEFFLNPESPTPLLDRPSPRASLLELVFLRVFCPDLLFPGMPLISFALALAEFCYSWLICTASHS